MDKPENKPEETTYTAADLLPQAHATLKAQADLLMKLLEEKRSLAWIQFATD
jgi:hypothetical protein